MKPVMIGQLASETSTKVTTIRKMIQLSPWTILLQLLKLLLMIRQVVIKAMVLKLKKSSRHSLNRYSMLSSLLTFKHNARRLMRKKTL